MYIYMYVRAYVCCVYNHKDCKVHMYVATMWSLVTGGHR